MNTRTRSFLAALFCVLFVFLILLALPAVAQDTSTDAQSALTISPDTAGAVAAPFIVNLAVKYPVILTIIAAIGTLRFFFKPVTSLLEAYVRSTPQKSDDEFYDKASHSVWFKGFAWFLDFGASIKVGPMFTAKPEAKSP